MKKRLLAYALTFALLLAALPFSLRADASESIETGYANVLYNSVNGLPTSEANDVAQTPDGFVWVGSYSGLIRYDGRVFKRMDSSTGINNVNVLYVDSRGRLWVGTNDSGAAVCGDDGRFTFYAKKDGLKSNSVRCFAEDGGGNIVIGTTDGLSYVSAADQELRAVADDKLPSRYINDLAISGSGRIYGITSLGDVFSINAFAVDQSIPCGNDSSDMPLCLYIDKNDELYIGTDGSTVLRTSLADGQMNFSPMSCGTLSNLNCIRKLGDRLWVCADNGVGYFEGDAPFHILRDLPLNNSIDRIYQDYENNFWLASSRQGILKITKNRFADISRAAGLPERVVNSTMLRDGLLYVATDKGLYILDGNYQSVENELTKLLDGVRVRCITKDSEGNLWLSTYEQYGLVKYDTQGGISTFTSANGMSSTRVRSTIQALDGSIVAATSNGVNVIKDGQVIQTFGEKDGLRNLEILTLCQAPDGTGYIGTDGGGLYTVHNGKIDGRLSQEDGLRSDIILRVKYDPQYKGLWIVTGNSLAFYDGKTVKTISQFPYPNNFDLFLTDNDGIWILSSNGIYVTTRASLLSGGAIAYRFFNYEDGLPSNITANSFSYADASGMLYLCGSSGVYATSLTQDQTYASQPKIALPDVTADDKTIDVSDGGVNVGSEVSRITINAFVLSYALHDPLVRYQLVGFDRSPITANKSELGDISYTNLKGGDYTFEISVIDENTGEVLNQASLNLHKTPTFRELPVYPVLLVLLVIGLTALLGYFLFRLRMKTVLKKHEETKAFMKQVIHAFAKAIDAKDKYTNGHSLRVAQYSRMLAEELGMRDAAVEDVFNTALLHDIGKIAIPDAILNKPGPLTDSEFGVMKKHTSAGGEILAEITAAPKMGEGACYHHERFDGSGYPAGLSGEQIPFVARIISVADAFDAMNSKRPYRDPLSREKIVSELQKCSGRQFDPQVAEAMLRLIDSGKVVIGGQPADGQN